MEAVNPPEAEHDDDDDDDDEWEDAVPAPWIQEAAPPLAPASAPAESFQSYLMGAQGTFQVTQVQGKAKFPHPIHLERLALDMRASGYKPQLKNFITWQTVHPPGKIMIWATGRVTFQGYKSESACLDALNIVAPIVRANKR